MQANAERTNNNIHSKYAKERSDIKLPDSYMIKIEKILR